MQGAEILPSLSSGKPEIQILQASHQCLIGSSPTEPAGRIGSSRFGQTFSPR